VTAGFSESVDDDTAVADGRVKLMPNVRRVYGDTKDETRPSSRRRLDVAKH
jgi:hypothetical protein